MEMKGCFNSAGHWLSLMYLVPWSLLGHLPCVYLTRLGRPGLIELLRSVLAGRWTGEESIVGKWSALLMGCCMVTLDAQGYNKDPGE